MSTILFSDLKEGDVVRVKDPVAISRLAKVVKFTREGKLIVQRRWNCNSKMWGPPLEVSLNEIVSVEVRT